MAIVVDFIRRLAPWAYGACALVALWYLRVVILARRERHYAVFTLEREAALNRVYGAWTAAIGLIVVMGSVYLLSTVVSDAVQPLIREGQSTPTPPPTGLALIGAPGMTPTLPLPETTPTATPTKRPRPTAKPQPTLAPQETPTPAVQRPRCADPRAAITAPGINAQVSGRVPILGTAAHENFQFYKLEWGPGTSPADNQWSYFAGGENPVQGGQLGVLDAGTLAPGTYTIRVVVVDKTGNNGAPPCQTTIVIR